MTWLQGITTWDDLCEDIAKLACGEIADDLAVTCAAGDQWVREISTSFDLIRSPASEDVNTGSCSNRAGYFTLCAYSNPTALTYTFLSSVCKVITPFSATPTTVSGDKWILLVRVEAPNSVNGNYSTASVRHVLIDGDTGTQLAGAGTATPNAAGNVTATFGTRTVTYNVSDPSGFLIDNTLWMRGFTTVYLGGIDWFGPMWARKNGNATYTVQPPGTVTTDYVKDVHIGSAFTPASTYQIQDGGGSTAVEIPKGGIFGGLGIKTVAGLGSGDLYTCSWNMSYMKLRLWAGSGATNGQVNLDIFSGGTDESGTYRRIGGSELLAWLRPFVTAGSVSAGSQVQFFMSVKPNKIIIVLNGEPASTGVLTYNGVYSFTPFDFLGGNYDKFPIVYGRIPTLTTSSITVSEPHLYQEMSYLNQFFHQDVSTESIPAARDWQTKWMRFDTVWETNGANGGLSTESLRLGVFCTHRTRSIHIPGVMSGPISGSGWGDSIWSFVSTKPNAHSGKWRLYSHAISDRPFNSETNGPQGTARTNVSAEDDYPRGHVPADADAPWLFVPGFSTGASFGNGDELTDGISGNVFFMVKGDTTVSTYAGLPGHFAATGAGIAILEE